LYWQWFNPTRIFFGRGVVAEQASGLAELGHMALLVTGEGRSSRLNGSLGDVQEALSRAGLGCQIFDQVEANPSLETVRAGAQLAREVKADVVIAVGGGSPLDAAKAIAVLAVNDLDDESLFAAEFTAALPTVAVPTTAGTGSEVTPYSILTYPKIQSKRNLSSPLLYPALALVDPDYCATLPRHITVDTAMDAYSHALEGYLSLKANPFSDRLAEESLRILGEQLRRLCSKDIPAAEEREALSYGSVLAGMVISQTGTSIPHALGYALTYFKDMPHGRANGLLLPAYLHFNLNSKAGARAQAVLDASGFDDEAHFAATMQQLAGEPPYCSEQEKQDFVEICLRAKNIRNNVVQPRDEDVVDIFRLSLG
jgi:alcohol dehydrogenase class IV